MGWGGGGVSLKTQLALLTHINCKKEENRWYVIIILSHLDYRQRQGFFKSFLVKLSSSLPKNCIPGIPGEGAGVFEDPVGIPNTHKQQEERETMARCRHPFTFRLSAKARHFQKFPRQIVLLFT